uniref:tyrosine-type recombinase/integrase n=1 Tax=Alistipes sp. TaxID=1872444 RepID=UPI004057AE63
MENYYSKDGITLRYLLDTRSKLKDGTHPVKIRVRYQRERIDIGTGKNLTVEEWGKIQTSRQLSIISIRKDIENSFDLVKKAAEELAIVGNFSLSKLKSRLKSGFSANFVESVLKKSKEQKELGHEGTSKVYRSMANNVARFAGTNVLFEDITPSWLQRYEAFLRSEGKAQTTIAIGMRTIRTIFNDAIRNAIIKEASYPFGKGKYEIQEGVGRKLALPLSDIGKIAKYETELVARRKYRDYWMFLYLCNGLNVVDFCRLKYSDIVDGEICIQRKKTMHTVKKQREIRVILSDDLKEIIRRHGNIDTSGYIFPIMNGNETPEKALLKTQYTTRAINKHMAEIAKELGLPHISTYTARHSFATVLKRAGVSVSFISESLGHSNIKTTEHYLASFEREEREKNARLLTQF